MAIPRPMPREDPVTSAIGEFIEAGSLNTSLASIKAFQPLIDGLGLGR
jgi:hypothetical protein